MAEHKQKYTPMRGATKTFQQAGHWVEKPAKTPVVVCACGNRYLKTRAGQRMCVRCITSVHR